jgi:hypothetical protein
MNIKQKLCTTQSVYVSKLVLYSCTSSIAQHCSCVMHMAVILCRMEAPQVKMQYMIWLEVTRYNASWFLSLKLHEDAANGCTGQVDMMELKHQINRAIATVTRGIYAMSGKKLSISWTSVMSLIAAHWEI